MSSAKQLFSTEVNGSFQIHAELNITQDPETYALTEFTETHRGIRKCGNPPEKYVPRPTSFISGELEGSVPTKDELFRSLKSDEKFPFLIGEAGTAKNTSIDAVYSRINQPVYRIQCHKGLTKYDLIAESELRNGNTVTTLKQAGKAAIFGGLLVLDELPMQKGLASELNSMCEARGKRSISLPGAGITLRDLPEDETWDARKHLGKYIHPEFRIVATGNPPGYTGVNPINEALKDRSTPIPYTYPGTDIEAKLIADDLKTDKESVKPLITVINEEFREPRKYGNGISMPISYRRIHDVLEYAIEHNTTLFDGANVKIKWYAQTRMDQEYIKESLKENKQKLMVYPGDSDSPNKSPLYSCEKCDHDITNKKNITEDVKAGVCPDCGGPFLTPNDNSAEWQTNFRSSHIARYYYNESDNMLSIAFYNDSKREITVYKYHNCPKHVYEDMCDANSKGKFVNNTINNRFRKKGTQYEEISTYKCDNKPKTIK